MLSAKLFLGQKSRINTIQPVISCLIHVIWPFPKRMQLMRTGPPMSFVDSTTDSDALRPWWKSGTELIDICCLNIYPENSSLTIRVNVMGDSKVIQCYYLYRNILYKV